MLSGPGGGAMATEEETIQLELMRQLEELNSLSVALPTKAQVGGQRGSASASLPPRRHANHLRVLSSWPTLLLALVVCVYTVTMSRCRCAGRHPRAGGCGDDSVTDCPAARGRV